MLVLCLAILAIVEGQKDDGEVFKTPGGYPWAKPTVGAPWPQPKVYLTSEENVEVNAALFQFQVKKVPMSRSLSLISTLA